MLLGDNNLCQVYAFMIIYKTIIKIKDNLHYCRLLVAPKVCLEFALHAKDGYAKSIYA
jgi:hypothetical protein